MSSVHFVVLLCATSVALSLPLQPSDMNNSEAKPAKRTLCITFGGNGTAEGTQLEGDLPPQIVIKTIGGTSKPTIVKYLPVSDSQSSETLQQTKIPKHSAKEARVAPQNVSSPADEPSTHVVADNSVYNITEINQQSSKAIETLSFKVKESQNVSVPEEGAQLASGGNHTVNVLTLTNGTSNVKNESSHLSTDVRNHTQTDGNSYITSHDAVDNVTAMNDIEHSRIPSSSIPVGSFVTSNDMNETFHDTSTTAHDNRTTSENTTINEATTKLIDQFDSKLFSTTSSESANFEHTTVHAASPEFQVTNEVDFNAQVSSMVTDDSHRSMEHSSSNSPVTDRINTTVGVSTDFVYKDMVIDSSGNKSVISTNQSINNESIVDKMTTAPADLNSTDDKINYETVNIQMQNNTEIHANSLNTKPIDNQEEEVTTESSAVEITSTEGIKVNDNSSIHEFKKKHLDLIFEGDRLVGIVTPKDDDGVSTSEPTTLSIMEPITNSYRVTPQKEVTERILNSTTSEFELDSTSADDNFKQLVDDNGNVISNQSVSTSKILSSDLSSASQTTPASVGASHSPIFDWEKFNNFTILFPFRKTNVQTNYNLASDSQRPEVFYKRYDPSRGLIYLMNLPPARLRFQ